MKKIVLITIILFTCFTYIFGQNNETNDSLTMSKRKSNFFGVNAGFTTGLGFSYSYMKKDGIQLTFLPLIDKEVKKFSLGFAYLRSLKEFGNSLIFVFIGGHLTNFFTEDVIYNFGIGPGIEGGTGGFKARFMIGYSILNIPTNTMSRPTVELGLFYNF